MLLQRECMVRVCQARHLVPRAASHNDGEKSLVTGLCVLISHDGLHVSTEVCRNVTNPSWQRIACFQLNLHDSVEEKGKESAELPAGERSISGRRSSDPTAAIGEQTQSLNPFAKNFVPPGALPNPPRRPTPPPSPPAALPPLRTTLILHFRVLGTLGGVLGDVTVDLVPLLESRGNRLASDRLGHVERPLQGLPADCTLAVDTWVALRQRTGEVRVQILIKPESLRAASSGGMPHSGQSSTTKKVRLAPGAPVGTRTPEGGSLHPEYQPDPGFGAWSEFDVMAGDGLVKVSLSAEQRSLDDRLLGIQEQYDFSAACGYRTGRPDEDAGEGAGSTNGQKWQALEWPTCRSDAAHLRRIMQLASLRNRRQAIAWAETLQSSSGMQRALRTPPAFGTLRRNGDDIGKKTTNSGSHRYHELVGELANLVVQGIPTTMQQNTAVADVGKGEDEQMGGAFEGGNEELVLLEDISTSVPHVEVVRVFGRLCCAEYRIQVKRAASGDSWFVIRRYSDFREFFNNLPRSFAAITPPLPPKSWRSLSFLSMTPGFLEDRRMALEVALRRLAINAVGADGAVQADLRAFLGFPLCNWPSRLAGVDAEVLRHLARVPPNLELALPARGPSPISLLHNVRLTMWMLLSGAAHKTAITKNREQYTTLVEIHDETEWCRQGGTTTDYSLAAAVFQTIDEDVNRTNVRDSAERERIRRVLRACSLKNPSTGYCQGMNSVALFLLRTAEGREDVAFWLLDALATTVVPGHWERLSHISTPEAGITTVRALMEERMPQLLEHLDSRGLPPEVLACDFMLSLGCRALPPTTVLRVWDVLFWEGGDTLQYVMLAVLRLAEDDLLAVHGASATSDCLVRCAAVMHDADMLIDIVDTDMQRHSGKATGATTNDGCNSSTNVF